MNEQATTQSMVIFALVEAIVLAHQRQGDSRDVSLEALRTTIRYRKNMWGPLGYDMDADAAQIESVFEMLWPVGD